MSRCAYCGHSLDTPGDPLTFQQRRLVEFISGFDRPVSPERIAAHLRLSAKPHQRTYRQDCTNVRVAVCHIRDVLGPNVIMTVKGQGYLWVGEKGTLANGKARTKEEARTTTAQRSVAASG